jgi:hypothetical protein
VVLAIREYCMGRHDDTATRVLDLIESAGFGYAEVRDAGPPHFTELATAGPLFEMAHRTSMTVAVRADLDAMPVQPGGVHASLRALALYLAEAVDAHGASSNPGTTARLAQELRTVLTELAHQDDSVDDDVAEFAAGLATPQRGVADTSWIETTEREIP